MTMLGTHERPLRVAVIGAGPSGFFAAESLLRSLVLCRVDMFDRLPAPYGLVRGGVAPDHPKIRTVSKTFEKTADHERFSYFGNVTVGRDITVDELRRFYDALLFTCGAETDRPMGIPGEELPGSHTATSFVGWYNGHPDFRDCVFDLSQEAVVVVGMGNVAMDVARILAKPVDELRNTDIAEHALDVLAGSRVREIHVVGRRGAAQVKFTLPELKEMGEIPGCAPVITPADLEYGPACLEEINTPGMKRIAEVMEEYSRLGGDGAARRVRFRFLLSPVELRGGGRVESAVFEKNRLTGPAFGQKARGTGETEEIPCGLVFRSIGYRGVPLPGVPFHERDGVFPNTAGRVEDNGRTLPGLYCAGWIKRGPSGIIGSNKPDSLETVKNILSDAVSLAPCPEPDTAAVLRLLGGRGVRVVSFDDWRKIDAAEIARGQAAGKPRERFTRVDEMLAVLD